MRHAAYIKEIKTEYKILIGILAGRRRLVRLMHRHRIGARISLVNTLISQLQLLSFQECLCSMEFVVRPPPPFVCICVSYIHTQCMCEERSFHSSCSHLFSQSTFFT